MASAPTAAGERPQRAREAEPAARPGLPPGPRVPALLQTLAWAITPTWVMDGCAKRLGESF
ncbi:MAG TPA: hypothetical protein VNY34_01905, partial [Solirubrobacteraceae bacterium]|nr:hypothetical protein [Solirubrobacteraceae bacterium]